MIIHQLKVYLNIKNLFFVIVNTSHRHKLDIFHWWRPHRRILHSLGLWDNVSQSLSWGTLSPPRCDSKRNTWDRLHATKDRRASYLPYWQKRQLMTQTSGLDSNGLMWDQAHWKERTTNPSRRLHSGGESVKDCILCLSNHTCILYDNCNRTTPMPLCLMIVFDICCVQRKDVLWHHLFH